jgi:hypothetical protein
LGACVVDRLKAYGKQIWIITNDQLGRVFLVVIGTTVSTMGDRAAEVY